MPANSTSSTRTRSGSSQDGTITPRSYGDMNPLDKQPFGNNGYDDAWYYSQIEQFKETDPEFYQYLLTNPHLISNSGSYTPYWTESLFGTADTSAARYYNQLKSDANEWLGRALSSHHVENYSDPIAEIARRKAAGINDDLSGGAEIGSGTPADPGKSEIDSQLPNVGDPASPESVIQLGTTIVGTALKFYQGFQGIRSSYLDNEVKQMTLSGAYQDEAWKIIGDSITEYMGSHKAPTKEELNDPSFVNLLSNSIMTSFGNRVPKLPYSNRQKRKLKSFIDELTYSFDFDGNKVPTARYQELVNNKLKDLYGSRSGATEAFGKIGADAESTEAQKAIANDIYRPLNQLALDLMKDNYQVELLTNDVKRLQNQFDTNYLSQAIYKGVPTYKAGSEAASYKLRMEIKKIQDKITDTFSEINQKITGNKKIGENWKMALEAGLATGESLLISRLIKD